MKDTDERGSYSSFNAVGCESCSHSVYYLASILPASACLQIKPGRIGLRDLGSELGALEPCNSNRKNKIESLIALVNAHHNFTLLPGPRLIVLDQAGDKL